MFIDLIALKDLPPGSQHSCSVGLTRVLLINLEGEVLAIQNLCPHARQPLAGGALGPGSITCPKHGARFDVRTGRPLNGVSKQSLIVFPVRIRDGRVEADISGTK